jgi:hypothetical protein
MWGTHYIKEEQRETSDRAWTGLDRTGQVDGTEQDRTGQD